MQPEIVEDDKDDSAEPSIRECRDRWSPKEYYQGLEVYLTHYNSTSIFNFTLKYSRATKINESVCSNWICPTPGEYISCTETHQSRSLEVGRINHMVNGV